MPVRVFTIIVILLVAAEAFAQRPAAPYVNGETARQRGDLSTAAEIFRAASEAALRADDKQNAARALISLGHVYYLQALYTEAVGAFRRAEKLAAANGDRRGEAVARAFLGQLYWRIGKVDDADMLLAEALAAAEATGDELTTALTLRFLGRVENGRVVNGKPNNAAALKLYDRSIAISRRIGDEEGELTTLKEIGLLYQTDSPTRENYERARTYFEDLRTRLKGSSYRRLYAIVLNNLATNAKLLGRWDASLASAEKAITLFREMGDLQELREVLDVKSVVLLDGLHDAENADACITESIALSRRLYEQHLGSPLDRQGYFESLIQGFRAKMTLAETRGRPDEMLAAQDEMRSWALLDMLRRQAAKPILSEADASAERSLLKALNEASTTAVRRKARLAYEEWQAAIETRYGPADDGRTPAGLSFEQMCRTLPDAETAIIKYENAKRSPIRVFVLTLAAVDPNFVISRSGLLKKQVELSDGRTCSVTTYNAAHWATPEAESSLAATHSRIAEFREQLGQELPSYKRNARPLYDTLLADAVGPLKGVKNLIIAAGGNVSNVPFQALVDPHGKFVIETFTVSYVPSIAALAEMQANRRKLNGRRYDGDLLALGDPVQPRKTFAGSGSPYSGKGLTALPEAAAEVRRIGAMFPLARILTGRNATEGAFTTAAPRYRILHLAAHGMNDTEKPLYSQLLLAADAAGDGVIEAREIAKMELPAELAVLSACETATGRELDGEGMVGLAWGFAAAGVPSVVASNWSVDSAATAEFMTDFYRELTSPAGATKAAALRTAALKRLNSKRWRHPVYWAGFGLYGVSGR